MGSGISLSSKGRTAILVALLCYPPAAFGSEVAPALEAEARWESSRPTALALQLISRAPDIVEVYQSDLPWCNHYSLILEAIRPEIGVVIHKHLPTDDPFYT